MNILYVCHRFPYPPKRGGKIRPFNMIRHMTEQGHKVWVASLARSEQEHSEIDGITDHCHDHYCAIVDDKIQTARMVLRLPLSIPSSMGYFYSGKLRDHISTLLATEKIDLVFVHCSSVAQYVEHVNGIPKVLDFGDMDSQKWLAYRQFKRFPLSLGYWLEGTKLMAAEKKLASRFDLCTATTRVEWETLQSYGKARDTDWFPNGVDSEFFKPSGEDYNPNAISFIGRMDYYPNQQCMLEFCAEVLPLLKVEVPDTQLFIVGAEPSREIRNLERIEGVIVTGSVPDVRPYIHKTAAMVAPLNIARGTQNKILEAMAMGVPVVSSVQAAGGIDAEPGIDILVARSPEEYSAHLLVLMKDRALRARFADAGRKRILSNHSWAASMQRMDTILERCMSSFGN